MQLTYMQNSRCVQILNHWKQAGIKNPHLLIGTPAGGTECDTFIYELARCHHAAKRLRSSFARSFLALEYPRTQGPEDYDKFFDSPRVVAERTNTFHGVFCVDISLWADRPQGVEISNLGCYASERQETIQFIFVVASAGAEAADKLAAQLRQHFRLETLTLDHPPQHYYVDYTMEKLCGEGAAIPASMRERIASGVKTLSGYTTFKGIDTIDRFLDELQYAQSIFGTGELGGREISRALDVTATGLVGTKAPKLGF